MSDDFWALIDETIDKGDSIDNIIPRDLTGSDESDFLKILALYITYGEDPKRRELCKRKWENLASR